jgi:LPS-assembly lipoprotein
MHHPAERRTALRRPDPGLARAGALAQAWRLALAMVLAMGLSACGFQPRGARPLAFQTAQLTGFAGNSPLATELARALQASGVQVVDSTLAAAQAASSAQVPLTHIVIDGMRDQRGLVVSTTTAYGQVRDMTARNSLRFRVQRGDGSVLLPPTEVGLTRDMSYNESNALAKQDESDALYRAMQSDIVSQVMSRLAAIRPEQLRAPAPPPKPPAPVTLSEWEAARAAAHAGTSASAPEGATAASTASAPR